MWLPVGIFLLTRIVDASMLMLALRDQFPASTFSGYGVPIVRDPHTYSNVIQSWDGQWFRLIAEHGYPRTMPTSHGQVVENQWGFYPLFPVLVRVVMIVTHASFGVAASILNLAFGATGMCVLYRMIGSRASRFAAVMTVVVMSSFPSAVVFQTAYSEALCFLLLVSALWFLGQRRYVAVMLTGILLSLTRPIVFPLAAVVLVHGLVRWLAREKDAFAVRDRWLVATTAAVVAGSFGLWSTVGWVVTGDPHTYVTATSVWSRIAGQQGSPLSGSWIAHAVTGDRTVLYAVVLAVALQWYYLLRQPAQLWTPELRAWSLMYGGFLLVTTGPLSSMTRHVMMAIVPWWPWPDIGEQVTGRRQQVLLATAVCAAGFVLQFFWIRYFWIDGPAFYSSP